MTSTIRRVAMKELILALAASLLLLSPNAIAKDADCGQCSKVCDATAKKIAKKGGKYAAVAELMQDCSKICKLSDDMHGSQFEGKVSALCAEVCNKCAAACEELKDKSLQNCIDECRKCEASCKKTAS
jgi:hypothetical protein